LTSGKSSCQAAEPVAMARSKFSEFIGAPTRNKSSRRGWHGHLVARRSIPAMRRIDAVLFTGSPPLMVHFIAPRGPETSKLFTGTIL
jgi:hypothetical protein